MTMFEALSHIPDEIVKRFQEHLPNLEDVDIEWVSFVVECTEFSVFLKLISDKSNTNLLSSQACDGKKVELEIRFKDGRVYGSIFGIVEKENKSSSWKFSHPSFVNHYLHEEFMGPPKKLSGHIKGVMRQTIKRLIIHGGISEWKSSDTLLDGGTILYESLMSDPDLHVVKEKVGVYEESGTDRVQYTVTKATDN